MYVRTSEQSEKCSEQGQAHNRWLTYRLHREVHCKKHRKWSVKRKWKQCGKLKDELFAIQWKSERFRIEHVRAKRDTFYVIFFGKNVACARNIVMKASQKIIFALSGQLKLISTPSTLRDPFKDFIERDYSNDSKLMIFILIAIIGLMRTKINFRERNAIETFLDII